ncbi:zinc-binding dehydrogenase [Salinibacterium sp. NG253]|uniref:zinc-binding dehydrogenase n=1 Tax=Salinibacterium sp. NG253 TaxID=2792039 RepID=UPI001E53381A|nr:zinc-binding dehydrogenase [Salinibacterium sp. NG253]
MMIVTICSDYEYNGVPPVNDEVHDSPQLRTIADLPVQMKAAILREGSPEYSVELIAVPQPRSGEALIRVAACGVCHSDLHVARGQIAFPRPAVLGHELSGTIVALGPNTEELELGTRVVAGFIMPCTKCENCLRGRDDICSEFFAQNRVNGALFDGESRIALNDGTRLNMYSAAGFAEYAVAPISALAAVADGLDLAQAAVLGCAGMTGYGAVSRAAGDVQGRTAAVIAVGGVGLSIVQMLAAMGASQVIAVDIDDNKLALAREIGATDAVNGMGIDVPARIRELTGGRGVDFAFEALGSAQTLGQAVRSVGEGGRTVAVGLAGSEAEVSVPITTFVRRGHSMVGSFGARTRVDLPAVVSLAAAGGFALDTLVTDTFGLDEINDAYRALGAGEIRGRAIVVFEEQSS